MAEWTSAQINQVCSDCADTKSICYSIYSLLSVLDMDVIKDALSGIHAEQKFYQGMSFQRDVQFLYILLRAFGLTAKTYEENTALYKLSVGYSLLSRNSSEVPYISFYSNLSEVESLSSGINVISSDFATFDNPSDPFSYKPSYSAELTFEKFVSLGEDEITTDGLKSALDNFLTWSDNYFGWDDLVKGEPYSLPPANTEITAMAICGGLINAFGSQIASYGTFALQILEQYQVQKLNYVQDVQFQLIIALFKTLVANQWPKGDLSEIMSSFGGLDTGLEYRAQVNDHWLNQSLTRALNSFTDETEFPLDTPSVEKVVAEKTDLLGVVYGNFKKIYPFQVFGAPFVGYLSTDFELLIHSYYQGRW